MLNVQSHISQGLLISNLKLGSFACLNVMKQSKAGKARQCLFGRMMTTKMKVLYRLWMKGMITVDLYSRGRKGLLLR